MIADAKNAYDAALSAIGATRNVAYAAADAFAVLYIQQENQTACHRP